MNTNHQSEDFSDEFLSDEFLSAYVDGELTGEQLAQVEQRLAADPQAAQLVEELRAMSQELQALPTEGIGEDLRATIMQRAERAMLLGTELLETDEPNSDEPNNLATRESNPHRRWIWAAFALAASLMLAIFLPTTQQKEQPLASAKPAQGGETAKKARETPRMEAVTTDGAEQLATEPANERRSRSVPAGAMAKEKVIEEQGAPLELTCTVHITLRDEDASEEQFAKLLVKNGIAFREGENREAVTHAEADNSEPEQLLLIEAQTEQIEDVLEACNLDTFLCPSVFVAEQQPTEFPIERLQQWNRSGKQLPQNKLRALKRDALAAKKAMQGWATRLDANQYQAGKLNIDRKLLDQQLAFSNSTPQPPIQVLFILQRATGEPTSAGESASAAGKTLKAATPDR